MWKQPSKTKEPDNLNKAYDYAVFLLSLSLRTIGEVVKKMQSRGYTEAIILEVIDRLKEQKYLDDQRYAEVYLENLKAYKNFGYYGIKKKFMEKKIPTQLVESVLAEGLSIADEIKIAERFLKRIQPSGVILNPSASEGEESVNTGERSFTNVQDDADNWYKTFDEEGSKQKQKLANRLKSRGFRMEVISKLVF
jgi:regulatory protein